MNRELPKTCPSCGKALEVKRLACSGCETAVEGTFPLPVAGRLDTEESEFLLNLLEASGSLKELATMYRVSYPTVRNRLDALRGKVRAMREVERITGKESAP